jgi:twitching motility protein PilT
MRDRETVELALTAAEMGVLVFGTLHTNSAAKTIDRVIDVFPAQKKNQIRSQLSNSLKGVVAQQLLRSADGTRRWAAYEILLYTPALPAIIRTGETNKIASLLQTGRQLGMITMDDCLMGLVQDGKVAIETAYMKAIDKSRFMQVK